MKNRHLESLSPKFKLKPTPESALIFCSSSDIGVRKNLGRNGARFGPQCILNNLKKMQDHLAINEIAVIEVSDQSEELINFEKAQEKESETIKSCLAQTLVRKSIHLGGGHDHVYPLLRALEYSKKQIIILNFDAHCDTRVDKIHHSGTPFRDFDKLKPTQTSLIQIGVHHYANSTSTLGNLTNIQQSLIYKKDLVDSELFHQVITNLEKIEISKDAIFILSLDADGLSAEEMEAVSAPNHNGFGQNLVRKVISYLQQNHPDHQQIFGIYEYNPIMDNLSQKGSRIIAGLIYDFFQES